ncbi:MAG: monovalent cation/H(+) antiporter subunit G [Pseudomonadota bacterium]
MIEVIAALLMIAGGVFCFSAALGLVRFPDVFMRMHAATKAGTLGILLLALGQIAVAGDLSIGLRAGLIAVFIIATAPIGAHLMGRAAYRTGAPLWHRTTSDPATHVFPRRESVADPQMALLDDGLEALAEVDAPSEPVADKATAGQ